MFGLIVGTRPSFIMAAPIIAAFDQAGAGLKVLHSAQHYSGNMDEVFSRPWHPRPRPSPKRTTRSAIASALNSEHYDWR